MTPQRLTAQTTVCAVIGNPVGHSLSPALHNACFAHCGLNWVYVAFCVRDIAAAVAGIRALGIRGASVTIPHKINALHYLDSVDPAARTIGSINTIVNDAGQLRGYNSDGPGALQALRAKGHDPAGRSVLMLGSGGAARAIAVTLALSARPRRLALMGIVPDELAALARDIRAAAACPVETAALTPGNLRRFLPDTDILINCTPVGMSPHTRRSPVPPALLEKHHAVFDIVYNPLETRLLADARRAGAAAVSGVEMFLRQAAVQFELWTGIRAPDKVMRTVVMRHLKQKGRGSQPS